jgi:integrase
MATLTGLVLRKHVFYFRQRVPDALVRLVAEQPARWRTLTARSPRNPSRYDQFVGRDGGVRTEVWKSLETSDPVIAREQYHQVAGNFFADAARLSKLLIGSEVRATNVNIVQLAQSFFQSIDGASEKALTSLILDHRRNDAVENIREDIAGLGGDSLSDPLIIASYRAKATELLREAGYDHWDGSAVSALSGYLIRAAQMERLRSLERASGNFYALPADSLFPPVNSPALHDAEQPLDTAASEENTLIGSYARYRREKENKGRSTKTLAGYEFVGRIIHDLWSDRLPSSLTTRDATELISVLQTLPANWTKRADTRQLSAREASKLPEIEGRPLLAPITANGYLGDVSAFFVWCVQEGLMIRNLVAGKSVKATSDEDEEREPFSSDDLHAIFGKDFRNAARLRAGAQPNLGPKDLNTDARFWAPLVALFTGMRLNEICQLIKTDIRQIDGVACICVDTKVPEDVKDSLDGLRRRLKTKASKRNIPVPDALISLGFLELVKGQSVRLFPDLKPDRSGRTAEPVTRWFGRYLDSLGITSKEKVFHSFRHTWRNANTNCAVMRDVTLYIGGWKSGEVSDTYNRRGPSMPLAKGELDKIYYPGLELAHLQPEVPDQHSAARQ